MSIRVEDWDETILDLDDYRAERALQNAALDAIRRARRCGTDYVICENGHVRNLKPYETEPFEREAVANLERLNCKIVELESRLGAPPNLSLNDKPTQ